MCRVIQPLRLLLAIEPATRPADAVERLWIVDGTLIPVRGQEVGASSDNYRFSVNVQVVIDADTKLVIAAARPVPGNIADAKAWRDSGLADIYQGVTVLGDGAYINTGSSSLTANASGTTSPSRSVARSAPCPNGSGTPHWNRTAPCATARRSPS